jgi:hypothetical protein
MSASKAPLNHAPPKAAELYCVRSFSLIKNLLQARNPCFSSPFNTQGHKGGGREEDGVLAGRCIYVLLKTHPHPDPPLEGEGVEGEGVVRASTFSVQFDFPHTTVA